MTPFKKGPIVHGNQKKSQYEGSGTHSTIQILEVTFPKCSLPNLWYGLDRSLMAVIPTIGSAANELDCVAPKQLTLPFFSPPQTKFLEKTYRGCVPTSCTTMLYRHELLSLVTGLVRAKEETQPQRWQRRRKLLLKMAIFPSLQHFLYSKPIEILFSKLPGFWL